MGPTNMVPVLNRHSAMIDGVPPGERGEVDANRPGVKMLLDLGLLVHGRNADAIAARQAASAGPSAEEASAMLAEIEARGRKLNDAREERDALEHQLTREREKAATLEQACEAIARERDALKAQVAALEDAATKPAADPPSDTAPAKGAKK